jgi:biotin transport system substrate-specific component
VHGRKATGPPARGSSRLDKLARDETGKRGTISTNGTSSLHGTLLDAVFPQSKDRAQAITRDVILIGCAVVLMTIASQISIPWHPVPLTGGTFGALLVGGLLGLRRAAIALVIYLAIGALGAGVFADWSGGWDYFTGSTGGYLVGYLVAALFVGFFADRGATEHVMTMVGVLLIANALIYAFGVPWLANWTPPGADEALGWNTAYEVGVQPFVPGDIVKLFFAACLLPGGWALLRLFGDRTRGAGDPS